MLTAKPWLVCVMGLGLFGCGSQDPSDENYARFPVPFVQISQDPSDENYARFLVPFVQINDQAVASLYQSGGGRPFFVESYAVRALNVTYDITQDKTYQDSCQDWSDRMLQYQEQMIPAAAYYMNYGRKPGESSGDWFVADNSTIGMAILSTAARTQDASKRHSYLDSVSAFADLVLNNFVRPSGGVSDGFWSVSSDEWWCSTALFASFLFLLHDQTGQEEHLQAALDAVDWLLQFDYQADASYPTFSEGAPAVLMYILEAYSAGLPAFSRWSFRRKQVVEKFSEAVDWMIENQDAEGEWNPQSHWGAKSAGLPFHLLIYDNNLSDDSSARQAAEKTLMHLVDTVFLPKAELTQEVAFGMFSFAERLSPGSMYQAN